MKKWKLASSLGLCGTVLGLSCVTGMFAFADPAPQSLEMVVTEKTVQSGSVFEMHVLTTPREAEDDMLHWSITDGEGVVEFEEYKWVYEGDDMEFIAVKPGVAEICCEIVGTDIAAYATVTVEDSGEPTGSILRVGDENVYVEVGREIELSVKRDPSVWERDLKWHIEDEEILRLEEKREENDDEMEFVGLTTGITRVACENTANGDVVIFVVEVVERGTISSRRPGDGAGNSSSDGFVWPDAAGDSQSGTLQEQTDNFAWPDANGGTPDGSSQGQDGDFAWPEETAAGSSLHHMKGGAHHEEPVSHL